MPAASTTQEPTTSIHEPTEPAAEPTPLPTQEGEPETLEIHGVDADTIIMKETTRSDNPNKTCAPCTPRKRSKPDVVIPIWEHDLCKLSYTVISIGVHDPQRILGTVVLLWASQRSSWEYKEALDQIKESVSASHKVKVVDLSEQVNSADVGPWVAQQVFKLKVAALVQSDFYVVLDARNALVRDLEPDVFFTECNQGKIFGEFEPDQIPQPYADWYEASARSLGVHAPGLADSITERWPTSITPVVIHRRTVLNLLDFIGEERSADRMCSGPLCDMLSGSAADGGGATDFMLFVLFARTQPEISCNLAVEDSEDGPVALTLWRSSEDAQMEANLQTCRDVASGKQQPYLFGSQTAALEQMSDEQRQDAQKLLVEIYTAAKLHDSSRTSSEALTSCVAGDLGGKAGPIEDVADDTKGFCCSDAQDSADMCGTCWEGAEFLPDTYCGASKKHCESCQGTWCGSSSHSHSDGEAKVVGRSNKKDAKDTGRSDKEHAKHTTHHSKDWRRWVKVSCEENGCDKYDTDGCECNDRCEQNCDDDMIALRRAMDKKFSAREPIRKASRSLDWTKVFLAASLLCMVTAVALALARRPRPVKSSSMHQVLVEDMSCSEA